MPSCVTVKRLQLSGICGDAYATCTYNGLNNVLCFAMCICVVVVFCAQPIIDPVSTTYRLPPMAGYTSLACEDALLEPPMAGITCQPSGRY